MPTSSRPSTPGSTRAFAGRGGYTASDRPPSQSREYNNTIRDLIGLDLRPADEFPSDDVGYGFDNIGDVLSTPPVLLEMYLAAAEKVIAEALRSDSAPAASHESADGHRPASVPEVHTAGAVFARSTRHYGPPPAAPTPSWTEQQRIYNILLAFCDRAFRRPATHDEDYALARHRAVGREGRRAATDVALRLALRAVLVSPQFLFLEADQRGRLRRFVPINDFALASRLSYFLWSSMPDEQLFRLAGRGSLQPAARTCACSSQANASRSEGACAGGELRQPVAPDCASSTAFMPDPTLFPDFDESLRAAMRTETELVLRLRFATRTAACSSSSTADYTFVNERLARHYGIAGVTGD